MGVVYGIYEGYIYVVLWCVGALEMSCEERDIMLWVMGVIVYRMSDW